MSSKYIKKHPIPDGFEELLTEFTKEILRNQPLDIIDSVFLHPSTSDIAEEFSNSSIYVMSSRFEGETLPVLVEEKNRTPGMVTGRTSHNLTVHFEGDESLIGQIVPVYLAESRGFYYFGKMR